MTVTLTTLIERASETARMHRLQRPEEEVRRRAEACAVDVVPGRLRAALSHLPISVIAEVKGASPLAGTLKEGFDPAMLARAYADGGADAVSVLTEETQFAGSLDHLMVVGDAVELPTLRKDFIVEPYQIWEAAVVGAAAVLLIADALDPGRLAELVAVAHSVHLDALVEVHSVNSIPRAERAGSGLIGVNNRDLTTMQVDPEHSLCVADRLPRSWVRVSESGIQEPEQIIQLAEAGYNAVLIGTALMRAEQPGASLKRLLSRVRESTIVRESRAHSLSRSLVANDVEGRTDR